MWEIDGVGGLEDKWTELTDAVADRRRSRNHRCRSTTMGDGSKVIWENGTG